MPARTTKCDFKTAASQRLIHIGVCARAIDHEQRLNGTAPGGGREQMPHAAKIAFAFLTHVADEQNVCGRFELRLLERMGDSQKRGDSGCVVTDPGTVKPVAFFTRLQRRTLRKNSIEMRADAYERRRPGMQ